MCICDPQSWQSDIIAKNPRDKEAKLHEFERACEALGRTINAYVPIEWRSIVCTCHDSTSRKDSQPGHWQCKTCDKASRVSTAYCADCKQFYYRGFDHHSLPVRGEGIHIGNNNTYGDGLGVVASTLPNGNRTRGRCWSCLIEKYGTMEGDVPPPSWAAPFVLDREAFLAAEPVDPFAGLF